MGKVVKSSRIGKLAGLMLLLPSAAWAGPEGDILMHRSSKVDLLLHELPSASSYNHLFEHFFLPTLVGLEESAGFSDIDPESMSIYGNSPFWTEWYFEGLNITDPFFDGAAAFKIPFRLLSSIDLRYAESATNTQLGGANLSISGPGRPARMAGVDVTVGGVGDIFPLAIPIMDFFSGKHARDRDVPPPEERRKMNHRTRLHLLDTMRVGGDSLRYAIEIDQGSRQYLSFSPDEIGQAGTYDEAYTRLSGLAEFSPSHGSYTSYLLAEYRTRDNLYAERYFAPSETVAFESMGVMVGLTSDQVRAGATFKHYSFTPNDRNFDRELIDLDGEGLFPHQPAGDMNALHLDFDYTGELVYFDGDLRTLIWSPTAGRSTHEISYDGQPFGSVEVGSQPTSTWVGNQRLGIQGRERLASWIEWRYDGYLSAIHSGGDDANGLFFVDVGLETDLVTTLLPGFSPFLTLSKSPVPITAQTALTLNQNYLRAVERTENGDTIRTLGGNVTTVDSNLLGTNIYALTIGFESHWGRGWTFTGQGLFKMYDRTYRLVHDGSDASYGEVRDGVYYYSDGDTRFRLENTPTNEAPFYMSGHFQIEHQDPGEHFFLTSFSMLNNIGYPAPSNGTWGNDAAVVDYSSANPNAAVFGQANMDADRAFVFKLSAGMRFIDTLWGTVNVAYRDGQPFAFYNYNQSGGQVQRTFASYRGSPLDYFPPLSGPREDFNIKFDAQLAYTLGLDAGTSMRLVLLAANLLDFGNEIGEISVPGGDLGRSSLESELPRSLHFSIELLETP